MDRRVTLTFDNGPTPGVTEGVLDTLRDHAVRATFFVVGNQLREAGAHDLATRAFDEGHWIGNHTMTHAVPLGDDDDPEAPEREVEQTQRLIGDLAHAARWFRPFGRGGIVDNHLLSPGAVDHLERGGYSCVLWTSVPRDWEDPVGWVDRCVAEIETQPWAVVVVHDVATGAMEQLPRLLTALRAQAVEIVQDFPDECVPIFRGEVRQPIAHLVANYRRRWWPTRFP